MFRAEQVKEVKEMNPFNFNVVMDNRKKFRRWAFYTLTAFVLTTSFIWGFITVYVNSYNVMHGEPMRVIEICDDGVVLFNRYYPFEQ